MTSSNEGSASTSGEARPEISAIVVTDHYSSVTTTMKHLRAQTARDEMEVVLVTPSREALGASDAELASFRHMKILEVGPLRSLPWGRAQGVRAASAPVVVLTETHSYPRPEWAQALIDVHRGPWAAVGPIVANANPESMLSWAALMIAYGQWMEGTPGGEVANLPGHNSSYKREVLLRYGSRLEEMMEVEARLHADLRANGHRFYLEPRAKTDHVNVSRPTSFARVRFHSGRLFGASRGAEWPPRRRVAYGLAAPLIVAVRLWRFVRDLRRPGAPPGLLPRVVPALVAGLVVSSVAEAVGYLAGPGRSTHGREDMELHRERHVDR